MHLRNASSFKHALCAATALATGRPMEVEPSKHHGLRARSNQASYASPCMLVCAEELQDADSSACALGLEGPLFREVDCAWMRCSCWPGGKTGGNVASENTLFRLVAWPLAVLVTVVSPHASISVPRPDVA